MLGTCRVAHFNGASKSCLWRSCIPSHSNSDQSTTSLHIILRSAQTPLKLRSRLYRLPLSHQPNDKITSLRKASANHDEPSAKRSKRAKIEPGTTVDLTTTSDDEDDDELEIVSQSTSPHVKLSPKQKSPTFAVRVEGAGNGSAIITESSWTFEGLPSDAADMRSPPDSDTETSKKEPHAKTRLPFEDSPPPYTQAAKRRSSSVSSVKFTLATLSPVKVPLRQEETNQDRRDQLDSANAKIATQGQRLSANEHVVKSQKTKIATLTKTQLSSSRQSAQVDAPRRDCDSAKDDLKKCQRIVLAARKAIKNNAGANWREHGKRMNEAVKYAEDEGLFDGMR